MTKNVPNQIFERLYYLNSVLVMSPNTSNIGRNPPAVKRVVDAADKAKKSYIDRSWAKFRMIFRYVCTLLKYVLKPGITCMMGNDSESPSYV